MSDQLTETPARHWTGTDQPLTGLLRIDGVAYRFLGTARQQPAAMKQTARAVTPTRTVYKFEQAGIELTLTFLTPALPEDLDVLSRPVTYIDFSLRSTDGRAHQTSLYFDVSSVLALNIPEQRVMWSRVKMPKLDVLRAGSVEQPMLAKSGDNLRIDWGYVYLATPQAADSLHRSHEPADSRSVRRRRSVARVRRSRDRRRKAPGTRSCWRRSSSSAPSGPRRPPGR